MMKINISIDDVSPHPHSSLKCLDFCFDILKKYSNAKFTLFVPTSYMRVGERAYDLRNHLDFVNKIKSLPINNFEIGYHGHFHARPPYNKGEFTTGVSYEACLEIMRTSKIVFKECDIEVQPIFRPPGFGLCPAGFKACKECGIEVISLYPAPPYDLSYEGEHTRYNRVVFVDCHPRKKTDWISPPSEFLIEKENLSIMYHACEWDKNYISKDKIDDLFVFMNGKKIKFQFTQDFHNG